MRAADGTVYLDAIAGIGCAVVGHGHPTWAGAIARQAARLASAAGTFWTEPQQELAAALIDRFPVPDGRVFFANTGTEATEAAIKLALRATGRDVILAFHGGFHGRTFGALSLTANPAYRGPFLRTWDGDAGDGERFADVHVEHLPYGDTTTLEAAFARHGERVAMVVVEPIQGEAGIFPATREFLLAARDLCDRHGALLGLDEVQAGFGRTGSWSSWTTLVGDDATPDLIWLAKALGGGFPIGACLARAELAAAMTPGTHGSTFGGNPLACAASLATLEIIESEGLLASAARQIEIVRELAAERPIDRVREVRGVGAMIGVDIGDGAKAVGRAMMDAGVLVTVCAGTTIRLLLPYRAGRATFEHIWDTLARTCASA